MLAYVRLHAGRRLRARDSTEDLVQSACREVLKDLPTHGVRTESEFRHWLYQAAERKLLDRARYWASAKRTPPDADCRSADVLGAIASFETPSRVAIGREEFAAFETAFRGLDDADREVILQARMLGLSREEIAKASSRSVIAVRVHLHRALARLAARWRRGAHDHPSKTSRAARTP